MKIAIVIMRKLVFSGLVFLAGLQSHLWWGYEYPGPGMNQWDVLFVVTFVAAGLASLYLLLAGLLGLLVRRHREVVGWLCDTILFAAALSLSVWAGVSAKIEG